MEELPSSATSANPAASAQATTAPSTGPSTTPSSTPDDRATTFKAVEGGGETVPGGKLLIAAYAVVWVIVLLLVVRVFRRQSTVEANVASLEDAIRKAGKK